MNYIQLLFTDITEHDKDVIIALLANVGYDGFEEENNTLKAIIIEDKYDEDILKSIIQLNSIKYYKSIIKEINWNEQWEANFEPVLVYHPITSKPFVYIRAGFHDSNLLFEYDIEVTPKMSFGTGHHATTWLMAANMSALNFKDKTVIDFGTGTGVLAILAEKMGASHVLAIDNDDWSINNARENIEVNKCNKIELLKDDTITGGNIVDIILANINLNIIKGNINSILKSSTSNTEFLFSGIMLHDEENILSVLKKAGLIIKGVFKKENWLCILAYR